VSPDRIRPGDAAHRGETPPAPAPAEEAPFEDELALEEDARIDEDVESEEEVEEEEEGEEEEEEEEEEDLTAAKEEAAANRTVAAAPAAASSSFRTELPLPEAANGEGGAPPRRPPRRHGALRRLYHGETHFDFVRRRRIWFAFSLAIIAAGAISLATRGLNLDIEFVGGTAWTVQTRTVTVTQARDALAPVGLSGATITRLGAPPKTLEVEAKLPKGQSVTKSSSIAVKVSDILGRLAHVNPANISVEQVGPAWGSSITNKAVEALIVFFVLVSLYISLFFEWRMALAAILAMVHDILVTVGIYSLTGFDVTPDSVVAFLTIIGYSLYDTIVVFDRVRDNARHLVNRDRMNLTDLVNLSMNQTLARSLNTSLVAILPILSVLVLGAQILGATTLQYFGLALTIGLTTGAYSSIFIASPLVALMKEREPHYRQLSERLRSRGIVKVLLSPVAVATGALSQEAYAPTRQAATQRAMASGRERTGPIRPGAATAVAEAPQATPTPPPRQRPQTRPQRAPAARRRRRGGRR
jgi:preprotein translocase subunit SecF